VRRARQLCAAAALALASIARPAAATADETFYAGKTLRLIVGLPAGGGADAYARLVQRHLPRHVPGTPAVVVQNMPGAGSLKSVLSLDSGGPDDGAVMVTFSAGLVTEAVTTPERIKVDFRNYAYIGSVSEDIRVCYVRSASAVPTWQHLLSRSDIVFGASAPGASGTSDIAMLRNLFGARIKQVQGYAGSAAKRLAIEKGEIDGECGGFTSMPDDWLRDRKVVILLRLLRTLVPGLDPTVPYAGDLLANDRDRQVYDFLAAPGKLGRLFMVSARVPPDRVAVLRRAFEATVADPAFLDEAQKLRLTIAPVAGREIASHIGALFATAPDIVARAKAMSGE
jgi:tripartite-type tricarboxylate transporter receptor subunit TctC